MYTSASEPSIGSHSVSLLVEYLLYSVPKVNGGFSDMFVLFDWTLTLYIAYSVNNILKGWWLRSMNTLMPLPLVLPLAHLVTRHSVIILHCQGSKLQN